MSENPYKLQVKIGAAEFLGEGSEDTVTKAYNAFLEAIKGPVVLSPGSAVVSGVAASAGTAQAVGHAAVAFVSDDASRDRIAHMFRDEDDVLSLRHQPPTTNKIADAAIVLMYGYKVIKDMSDVPVMKLNEGLRRVGLNVKRLDRVMGANQSLFRKGGQKSGARYSLTNLGMDQAAKWIAEWE